MTIDTPRHSKRILRSGITIAITSSCFLSAAAACHAQPLLSSFSARWFACRVLDYSPAPGQFVNDPHFNNPLRALGPPVGGGTLFADNSKMVTLGGFGGSITLGFSARVMDDDRNPLGLDCIVFGNAFWVGGSPDIRWAEAGVIEISLDVNHNRRADDAWYVIPGSSLSNPGQQMQDGHYLLPADPFASLPLVNANSDGTESWWGYADMSPTLRLGDTDGDNIINNPSMLPQDFYTIPDDPLTVGMTPGSGGGDAFDIAWAVDPRTNQLAHLPGFDFIRISTGADGDAGIFGEVSTEIGGVAIVRPVAH